MLLETLLPLGLLVAAKLLFIADGARLKRKNELLTTWCEVITRKDKVLSGWLSAVFLVLPVIARTVCQSFRW